MRWRVCRITIGILWAVPAAGQDRQTTATAARAPLAASVATSGEGPPLVLLIQNPPAGVYQAALAVELRYSGLVVGKASSGPLPAGQSRKLAVPYGLPRGALAPITFDIVVNRQRLGAYTLTSRATIMGTSTSGTKPTQPVPTSGVEPATPTATPSAILPPRLEAISYQWLVPPVPAPYPTLTGKQTGATAWVLPVVEPYQGPGASLVKFLWRFNGPKAWVDDVINGGCCLEVRVNDVPITSKAMHVSWAGEGLIRTALAFYPFTTSFAQPRRVQFSLTHLGQKFESQHVTIWRGEVHQYFTRFMYPIFQHARCTTCHSLGDAESLLNQHKADDIRFSIGEPLFLPGVAPKVCQNCHVEDWRTPHASLGIDWRGKSAAQICAIVNQRLPTKEAKTHHFHDDPRIEWAVSNGQVLGREKPVVPPGTFAGFLEIVDTWIERGAPCPPQS